MILTARRHRDIWECVVDNKKKKRESDNNPESLLSEDALAANEKTKDLLLLIEW